MNWVGGTRNRLRAKNEKKRQKEFFEKQKYARRMRLHQRGERSKNEPSPSLDIISLQMAHLTAQQFKGIDASKSSKPLKQVNMDRPYRNDFHIQRRHHNVELPTSPCSTPSVLQLSDDLSRRDLPLESIQAPCSSSSVLSEGSKSCTSHQCRRLQESRPQALCSLTGNRQTSRNSVDDLTISRSHLLGKRRLSEDSLGMSSRFSEGAAPKENSFFSHNYAVTGRKSFSDSSVREQERFSHDTMVGKKRSPVKLPVEARRVQYSEHTMRGLRRSGEVVLGSQDRYPGSPRGDQQVPAGGLLEVQKRSSEDIFFQFTSVAQQSMRVSSSSSSQIRKRRPSSSTEMSMSTDSSDDFKIYTPEKYRKTRGCYTLDDVRKPRNENAEAQSKCESSYRDYYNYPHVINGDNNETSNTRIGVGGYNNRIGSSDPHSSGIAGSPSSSRNIPEPVTAPEGSPSNAESKSSIDLLCHEVTNFTSPESDYSKSQRMQPHEIEKQLSQQNEGLYQHTLHTPCGLSTERNKPSDAHNRRSSSNSSLSSLGDGFPRTVLQEVLELDEDLNRRNSSPGIHGDIDELSCSPKKKRRPNSSFVESFNTYDKVSIGSHTSSSDSCITPPTEQSRRQNQSNPEKDTVSGGSLSPFSSDVQQRALESIALSTPENALGKIGGTLRNSNIAKIDEQSKIKPKVDSLPTETNFTGSGMDQQHHLGSRKKDVTGSGTNQLQVLSSSEEDIGSRFDQLQHLGSGKDQHKDWVDSRDLASTDLCGIKHVGVQCEAVSVKTSVSEQAIQCDISLSVVCNDTDAQTEDTLRCDVATQWEEKENRFRDDDGKIHAEPSISAKSKDDEVTSGHQSQQLDVKSLTAIKETIKYQQNAGLDENDETCLLSPEDKVTGEVYMVLEDELSKDEGKKERDDEKTQGDAVFVRKMEAESTDAQLNEKASESQHSTLSDSVNLFSIESSTSDTFDSCKSD